MTIIRRPDRRAFPIDPDQHGTAPADTSTDRLGYSIEEFAARVGIGRTLAYQAAIRGEIPTRRIGRRLIVPKAALDAWLAGDGAA